MAAAGDIKNIVHYGIAFVALRTKLECKQLENGTTTVFQLCGNMRVAIKTVGSWAINNEVVDRVCEEAAKCVQIDGQYQPERWTERAITCIFYAGTVNPDTASNQSTTCGCVFDVMCSYETFDHKVRTEIVRMEAANKSSPATLGFHQNLQKKVYGISNSDLCPTVHSITCVSSK
jgi:hypothetical protein